MRRILLVLVLVAAIALAAVFVTTRVVESRAAAWGRTVYTIKPGTSQAQVISILGQPRGERRPSEFESGVPDHACVAASESVMVYKRHSITFLIFISPDKTVKCVSLMAGVS